MNDRENRIRAWRFQGPETIPIASGLPWLNWAEHGYDPEELDRIMLSHKVLLPNYKKGDIYLKDFEMPPDLVKGKYVDGWGCTWDIMIDGMVGAVTSHPLKSWDDFDGFHAPDPAKSDGQRPIEWERLIEYSNSEARKDEFFQICLDHAHTFLRIQNIRGYENFMYDMADDNPNLHKLISMVEEFNIDLIKRYVELKPDCIGIPEDLGAQTTPLLSPDIFRKYIKPSYLKMTSFIKGRGIIVHEHSDGFILPLIDDLVECGGDVINLQDLVNGVDNIKEHIKGRLAIDLDIDRQNITVHGSAGDIDDHIHEAVSKLGSIQGGLSLAYQSWPPTPAKNLDAVFTAMEKYRTYYA